MWIQPEHSAVWKQKNADRAEAIARNLYEMSGLKVPVITFMIGEGGSGGALGTGSGNEVWMMEMQLIPYFLRKALHLFSGKMESVQKKQQR